MTFGVLDVVILGLAAGVLAIVVALTVKILQKAGLSVWWCIPSLIPFLNVVLIWVFAWAEWPALATGKRPAALSPDRRSP